MNTTEQPEAPHEAESCITNLADLCRYFSAEEPRLLNKRIYKGTDCGASISVTLPDGSEKHNGDDWTGVTEITGFTIQTIVEGSEATVDSDFFELPVDKATVDEWMEYMEGEAKVLWNEANGSEFEGLLVR